LTVIFCVSTVTLLQISLAVQILSKIYLSGFISSIFCSSNSIIGSLSQSSKAVGVAFSGMDSQLTVWSKGIPLSIGAWSSSMVMDAVVCALLPQASVATNTITIGSVQAA